MTDQSGAPQTPPGNISSRLRWLSANGPQSGGANFPSVQKLSPEDQIRLLHQQIDELSTYVYELAFRLEREGINLAIR